MGKKRGERRVHPTVSTLALQGGHYLKLTVSAFFSSSSLALRGWSTLASTLARFITGPLSSGLCTQTNQTRTDIPTPIGAHYTLLQLLTLVPLGDSNLIWRELLGVIFHMSWLGAVFSSSSWSESSSRQAGLPSSCLACLDNSSASFSRVFCRFFSILSNSSLSHFGRPLRLVSVPAVQGILKHRHCYQSECCQSHRPEKGAAV